jgi:hypothetical protein
VRIGLTTKRFELPDALRSALEDDHLLSSGAVHLVDVVTATVIEVAAAIGRDYDENEGDDQNLAGLLCSGRTRNLAATRLRSEDLEDELEIEVFGTGLTTLLRGGGTEVHPYSCGGAEAPLLAGSATKKRVLKEGSEQLALFSAEGESSMPLHVVVAYSRDLEGVVSAKVGVMSGPEEFAWELAIYERPADADVDFGEDIEESSSAVPPSHDRQPVDEPAVKLRRIGTELADS